MNAAPSPALPGQVASLHLHPAEPGRPLQGVEAIELVAAKGISGDTRYFDRLSRDTGKPTRRQVTLIEREQIAEHAAALGLDVIPPGAVRSNIETEGINLVSLLGRQIQIGDAILLIHTPRDPCAKMDAICQGLRARMMDNRQGVLAEVVRSGSIRCGDAIRVLPGRPQP
jgi:MOSC domain-containing protein YiiM